MQAALIDASDLSYQSGLTYSDIHKFHHGKEIGLLDIHAENEQLIYLNGLLVSVNMKEITSRSTLNQLPKLHISFCKTLALMKDGANLTPLTASCRMDTVREIRSVYHVGLKQDRSFHAHLNICPLCLENIKWKNFNVNMRDDEKDKILSEFSFKDFYIAYSADLYADYARMYDLEVEPNTQNLFTQDWYQVSSAFKAKMKWRCSDCRRDFEKNKSELYVKHINGIKTDNRMVNLKALCSICCVK